MGQYYVAAMLCSPLGEAFVAFIKAIGLGVISSVIILLLLNAAARMGLRGEVERRQRDETKRPGRELPGFEYITAIFLAAAVVVSVVFVVGCGGHGQDNQQGTTVIDQPKQEANCND